MVRSQYIIQLNKPSGEITALGFKAETCDTMRANFKWLASTMFITCIYTTLLILSSISFYTQDKNQNKAWILKHPQTLSPGISRVIYILNDFKLGHNTVYYSNPTTTNLWLSSHMANRLGMAELQDLVAET